MSSLQAFLLVSTILAAPYLLLRFLTRHESGSLAGKLAKLATIMFAAAEVMLVIAALEIAPEHDGYPLIITVYGSGAVSLAGILLVIFGKREQVGAKARAFTEHPVMVSIWRATVSVLSFVFTLFIRVVSAAASSPINSQPEGEREGPRGGYWWQLNNIPGANYRRDD